MVTQGKRGTRAALGYGHKTTLSLFAFSGLARPPRAKPEKAKREAEWGGW